QSECGILFGITCWQIWKARNSRIFSNSYPTTVSVAIRSQFWTNNVKDATKRECFLSTVQHSRQEAEIAWDPGPVGWVTLNSDGSVDSSRAEATAGGLVRDNQGRCILAYTMNLGRCSITRAEMRGAIEGLNRTWEAGYRRVVLQMDSSTAISLLTSVGDTSHQHGMEVLQFRELCRKDWLIQIKHTYREGNHAADFLAIIGYNYPYGNYTVSVSDCNLGYFLRYDCMGITETRSILIND
ncbi:Putative ribonuclease H protein At1g65750, partial [Linum perenne]